MVIWGLDGGMAEYGLSEILLRIACYRRRQFFKFWNKLHDQEREGRLFLSLSEKLIFLLNPENLRSPEQEVDFLNLPPVKLPSQIRFVAMGDAEYPLGLLALPQPPLGLFVQGSLVPESPTREPRVAMIGSRKPSVYSSRLTRELSREWTRRGFVIVSGGAIGIDGEAHKSCVENGGKTWAVLGGGHRFLHPRSHVNLFSEILKKGGALISEYPPDFEPKPYTFPERNRLIAALSDVLFLAQAHEKSGSLSTARTALDLGRDIWVLKPIVGDANFLGSQALIDAGARSCLSPEDIFQTV